MVKDRLNEDMVLLTNKSCELATELVQYAKYVEVLNVFFTCIVIYTLAGYQNCT